MTFPRHVMIAERVCATVAAEAGIRGTRALLEGRVPEVCAARMAAYWILYRLGLSYALIGRLLGRRDHSTIMHGVRVVSDRVATNSELYLSLQRLQERAMQGSEGIRRHDVQSSYDHWFGS